jgi:dipeptidyl aminopeptidase/acylaminoacyl peptidase
MPKKFSLTLLALLTGLGCDKATAPEVPLSLPLTDRIVFESDRSNPVGSIYAMKFDGTDVRRLTWTSGGETCPSISPDGNWIAFYTNLDPAGYRPQDRVWLMRANGTELRAIADVGYAGACPLWTRTSDAFATTVITYAAAKSATEELTLTFALSGQELARFKGFSYALTDFSSDGLQFLGEWSMCGVNGCTVSDVAVRARDGSSHRWLTGGGAGPLMFEGGRDPALSPDGTTVAYICLDPVTKGWGAVCTVKFDGSGKTQISGSGLGSTRFSPDGRRISFQCAANPYTLCVMDADGANRLGFAAPVAPRQLASWTPDGSRLVFMCREKDICIIPSSGGTLTYLTENQGTNANPSMARVASH